MSDLKPCPFCGDIPELTIWYPSDGQHRDFASNVWIVFIKSDFVEIIRSSLESEEDARNKAIKAWNLRPGQWQDISTAPRDGSRILGLTPFGVEIVKYCDETTDSDTTIYLGWIGCEQDSACLPERHCIYTGVREIQHQPTHWMPLPEPPKGDV